MPWRRTGRTGSEERERDMSKSEKAPLAELASLPARDVDAETSRRILTNASRAFAEAHRDHADRGAAAKVARGLRVLMPVALAGTVSVYLAWAVNTASALFH
jgi:hypothetical protein